MKINFNEITKIKEIILIESDWKDFINLINRFMSYDSNYLEFNNYTRISLIRFYDRLTMAIDGLENSSIHFLSERDQIKKIIKNNNRQVTYETPIISLTNIEKTTGKHQDNNDVLYVQFIGLVAWKFWNKDRIDISILSPGDAIFVPKNIYHEVMSITPRAGISFTII